MTGNPTVAVGGKGERMDFFAERTLLLMVDVQNDFCPAYSHDGLDLPEGKLAVGGGGGVVDPLNALSAAFVSAGARVAATQDWHPPGHCSFASSHPGKGTGDTVELAGSPAQVLWPDHCVRGTPGADFRAGLETWPVTLIVRKGFRRGLDSYSAFFENDGQTSTGLGGWIRDMGIDTVVIGGLALDYCVCHSAVDAARLGFSAVVALDATRGVNVPQGSVELAVSRMRAAGVMFADSAAIIEGLR